MPRIMLRPSLFLVALILIVTCLSGCRTITSSGRIDVSASARWVVLPVKNLSSTPLAGDSATTIVETQLRKRGVQQLLIYQSGEKLSLASIMNGGGDLSTAQSWAKDNGFQYAITGTVHEWQYKNGIDKEPVVGLSLKLIDLSNNNRDENVIWQASAAKTGWGFANLSGVADSVIGDLLEQVRIKNTLITSLHSDVLSTRSVNQRDSASLTASR